MDRCYQCDLPLPSRPIRATVEGQAVAYCCYGCYFVHRATGERGETGTALGILARLGGGAFLSMNVMVFSLALYSDAFYGWSGGDDEARAFFHLLRYLLLFLATPVMLLLGLPILTRAIQDLRYGRISVDSLIAVGAFSAYGLSAYATLAGQGDVYFETATMILLLVTLGRYLEARAKVRAAGALQALLSLIPPEASVVLEGREVRRPVSALRVGDRVRVRPGERFPADGEVVEGEGAVDASSLTGEGLPATKGPGDPVHAGTLSVDGSFLVRVLHVGQDTVLERLRRLLEAARNQRTPLQRMADRVAAFLTPAVLVLALGTFSYWSWASGFQQGLMTALAVLLIACPCALGIATPLAVWMAVGETARRGILVRSGETLERLPRLRGILLDKTGTLTTGTFRVKGCVAYGGRAEEALAAAAALEVHSEHPLARALVAEAERLGLPRPSVTAFRAYPGLGVSGELEGGTRVAVGSREFMNRLGIALPQQGNGGRPEEGFSLYIGRDGMPWARVDLAESLREEAKEVVAALRHMGLHTGVLTGDHRPGQEALARELGVTFWRGGLLPDRKVDVLRTLRQQWGPVAMVGDGINDAPVLAAADVGIAMGCGTDLARDAAAVNLTGDDLRKIPWLLRYARRVVRTIRWNLFWAFLYNGIGLGLAAAGKISPILAALAMVASSTLVVSTSTRLRSQASEIQDPERSPADSGRMAGMACTSRNGVS